MSSLSGKAFPDCLFNSVEKMELETILFALIVLFTAIPAILALWDRFCVKLKVWPQEIKETFSCNELRKRPKEKGYPALSEAISLTNLPLRFQNSSSRPMLFPFYRNPHQVIGEVAFWFSSNSRSPEAIFGLKPKDTGIIQVRIFLCRDPSAIHPVVFKDRLLIKWDSKNVKIPFEIKITD